MLSQTGIEFPIPQKLLRILNILPDRSEARRVDSLKLRWGIGPEKTVVHFIGGVHGTGDGIDYVEGLLFGGAGCFEAGNFLLSAGLCECIYLTE